MIMHRCKTHRLAAQMCSMSNKMLKERSLPVSLIFGHLILNSFFTALLALCEVQLKLISCSLRLQEILALLCLPHTAQQLLHKQQKMRQIIRTQVGLPRPECAR